MQTILLFARLAGLSLNLLVGGMASRPPAPAHLLPPWLLWLRFVTVGCATVLLMAVLWGQMHEM